MIRLPATHEVAIVDDCEIERMILDRVLERSVLTNPRRFFASVAEFSTHFDAVLRGAAALPALLLLDLNMPGATGFDLLATLQQQRGHVDLPVIAVLSSSDADSDQRRALEFGADLCLQKPSGLDAFVELIDTHFTNDAESAR